MCTRWLYHFSANSSVFNCSLVFNAAFGLQHLIGRNSIAPLYPFHSCWTGSYCCTRTTDVMRCCYVHCCYCSCNMHKWNIIVKISSMRDWWSSPLEWLSGTRDLELDLGLGHTAYRCASLIELYLHIKFLWNRKNFCGRTIHRDSQVQGHVTQKN